MNLIDEEIVSLKISKIILGVDPSNFRRKSIIVVYKVSRHLKTSVNVPIG